ncbi:MAG: hypothetical protein C0608_03765 [Deltaproteobacteria bacterium]|nr:MAG: hypothetical protein C0608_03765 [Deltaproteobacteria bacterium]
MKIKLYNALTVAVALVIFLGCAPTQKNIQPPQGEIPAGIEELALMLEEEPEAVDVRIALAKELLAAGDPDAALRICEEGLSSSPGDPSLLHLKARSLWELGWNDLAADAAFEAVESGAGSDTQRFAIHLLDGAGRADESLEVARIWSNTEGQNPEAHYTYGKKLAEAGEEEKAIKAYEDALAADPNHANSLSVLALYSQSKGDKEKALSYFKRLLEIRPAAELQRGMLVELLARDGRVEEALSVIREGVGFTTQPELLSRYGVLAADFGDFDLAIVYLDSLIEQEPEDGYWYLLGTVKARKGDFDGAVKAFREVADKEFFDMAQANIYVSLSRSGKKEEGRAILDEIFSDIPEDPTPVYALAEFLSLDGEGEKGLALLEGYITAHGKPADPRFFFTKGTVLDSLGDWSGSIEAMREVLALEPDDPYALNYIAYTHSINGGDLVEAESMVRRALEAKPESGPFLDTLGWVLYKAGRYEEAREELTRAVALSPDDAVIVEHLGDVEVKLGNIDAAREAYEKSLKFDPENADVKGKLEELK